MPEVKTDYDKMRPPKKDGKATQVYFHVTVMGIDSINENSMTYAADIFFAQTWKDHRLRLPENMTSEYRLTLKLSCAMNFAIYPHDTQECKLQMESLSHTTEELVFEWDPVVPLDVDPTIELPQQDIIRNYTSDCTQVYSTGNFTCLEVVFTLKRRLGYYVFHTYIPTCLIVIMSWVSFWIKPEIAPARVTLGVTSLLTLFTQQAKSQASLPPVSYIKTIDIFMSSCTVFVFMVLIEYAVVNIILGDGSGDAAKGPAKPEPKPSKATDLAIKESRRFLLGEPPKPPGPTPAQIRRNKALMVDRVSRYVFPTSFALLNGIYWFSFRKYL
ncbi:glycine receptor subunit alphaZ1-like isoform X2 [Scylla paramamosain]|uniref:glycine receptor subunit alphaZ1-like isoform X2 n=1 Tax=Scylla paramamosain TaxID=85552 RepID=UPI0030828FBA